MVELRSRAAVERLRDRDAVAPLEQREEEGRLSGKPAREGHRARGVLEVGDPLLERGDRRIHDPAVDVPVLLQVEVRRRRLGVLEDEARRLVNGRRAGAGVGIRTLPGVHGAGVEPELAAFVVLVAHRGQPTGGSRTQSSRSIPNWCVSLAHGAQHEAVLSAQSLRAARTGRSGRTS